MPQALPQPPQFAASVVAVMHFESQRICGNVQTSVWHLLPLQTWPGPHSASLQQSKQPVPAQQVPPLAHDAPAVHTPLVQVSAVHELPSLHWESLQHTWHAAPQSFGVVGAHAQLPSLQTAPLLQAVAQAPQCAASARVSTSQSFELPSQLA
jgi:hypothetical protein